MITCTIKIVEVPGKGYFIDMVPDQSSATTKELRVAGFINHILTPVFEYLIRRGGSGEMIESKDAEIMRLVIEAKIKAFETDD
jgi:hypothetical protein